MPIYRVYGNVNVGVTIEVQAESKEEAIEIAENEFSELVPFAGNGGMDRLVGTDLDNVSLETGDVVIYTSAEEV